jgi:hypothetical protein
MKSFKQWAESKKLDLPLVEAGATKRGGIAHWAYPDAYVRQQYPGGYFTPIAADALWKMGPKADDKNVDHGGIGPNTALGD